MGEVNRHSESHLRAVMPATKGIDAFFFGTLELVILIVPLLKEYVCADVTRATSKIGTRESYNF